MKFKETTLVEVIVPFESQEEILKLNLKNQLLRKVDLSLVKDISFSVVREDNFVRLDCSVKCEIDLTL